MGPLHPNTTMTSNLVCPAKPTKYVAAVARRDENKHSKTARKLTFDHVARDSANKRSVATPPRRTPVTRQQLLDYFADTRRVQEAEDDVKEVMDAAEEDIEEEDACETPYASPVKRSAPPAKPVKPRKGN